MSCAEMAEPIEMQFGLLSQVGQENMYTWGVVAPREGTFLGCLVY